VDALSFLRVCILSGKCLNRPIVTRAHVPRQVGLPRGYGTEHWSFMVAALAGSITLQVCSPAAIRAPAAQRMRTAC
jgi:hypothetical protein